MAVESGSIKVEGLAKTIKSLRALGAEKSEFQNLNLQAAQTILATATPNVPSRTGKLKASLRAAKTVGYAMVRAGNARVPYANPIHWGWFEDQNNFIQKNIRPNPFLMRALKKDYNKLITDYDNGLQALINKYELGD